MKMKLTKQDKIRIRNLIEKNKLFVEESKKRVEKASKKFDEARDRIMRLF